MAEAETKAEYLKALEALTRYLAVRDHSPWELKCKLERRFDEQTVNRVLTEARENGWLAPDETLAENLAESLKRKNKSRRYIVEQLRRRRLPVIALSSEGEIEKIRTLLNKKFGGTSLNFEDKTKAIRFLKYRGFEDRAIRQVLNEE